MIRLDGVGKTYPDGTVAVQSLSLDVPRGTTVCLVGPSGCGKSTTLKMVNRLIEPTSGSIYLDGEDVTHTDPVALRRRIGYVIQQVGLFPHQKIRANVATVPVLIGWEKRRASARAEELLAMVGLDPSLYADRYPHQLSGGEQQRVGVARALAADPPVLLMDEPFGAVDPIVRGRLQDEFARLARDLDKTVLFVTHDIDEAVRLGDLVAVFATGGRIAQYDVPAQILGAPADDFVARFVGSSRGLRRLAVTPITRDDLIAPDGRSARLTIPLGA
ncbi:MAG TPA: ATP-binding cassette domain-containing protein, partial [Nocardioidaceae bacterium]|nr:ATP-binding cassette domain-containing protein [Nocardioidaceae bacterium]